MNNELFKNKDYSLLAEVPFPVRNPGMDSERKTLYVFAVTDEREEELEECYDLCELNNAVLSDLGLSNDYHPEPGALYHRFTVERPGNCIILLYDTMAYNV